ncbi:hypothetical protein KC460_04800, partial [Candidatus Dependentiae bacterium]|nr:hypothetical protein [Candidatus Dependentiae bacterium]
LYSSNPNCRYILYFEAFMNFGIGSKYIEKTQHVIKPTYPVIISINKWIVLKNNKKIRVNANAKVQKLNTKLTISLDNKKIINNMEIKVDIGSAARSKDIKDAINLALQQALLQ